MEQSDEQLVNAYRNGDEGAFVTLIERHFQSIYSYVYRFVYSATEAEDIVQETFIKVWRQLDRFKHGTGMRPWLFRIARNTAIDYLRKKKHIPFSHFSEDGEEVVFEDTAVNLLEESIAREQAITIADAVAGLPDKYREVVLLRVEQQLTFEEIAGTIDKPLNTVKSIYRRGLVLLQKALAPKSESKA